MEGVGDAHRKRQQAAHPDLTLTYLYNAVEAVRAGRPLTAKERKAHDAGLATTLLASMTTSTRRWRKPTAGRRT